jgi:hypothetical protein
MLNGFAFVDRRVKRCPLIRGIALLNERDDTYPPCASPVAILTEGMVLRGWTLSYILRITEKRRYLWTVPGSGS